MFLRRLPALEYFLPHAQNLFCSLFKRFNHDTGQFGCNRLAQCTIDGVRKHEFNSKMHLARPLIFSLLSLYKLIDPPVGNQRLEQRVLAGIGRDLEFIGHAVHVAAECLVERAPADAQVCLGRRATRRVARRDVRTQAVRQVVPV